MKNHILYFIGVMFFLSGCGMGNPMDERVKKTEHHEIRHVRKILLHKFGQYTIYYGEGDNVKMVRLGDFRMHENYFNGMIRESHRVILDAKEDQWIEYDRAKWYYGDAKKEHADWIQNIVFHLKDMKQLAGGYVDNGKFGHYTIKEIGG